MRTMYDTINTKVNNIPPDAQMVAGYDNGKYRWSDADWARFPNAIHIHICIYIPGYVPPNTGHVLDLEAGDVNAISLARAEVWGRQRQAAGIKPTMYTSKDPWMQIRALPAFSGWDFWISDPTGSPHILTGTVATQYSWADVYDQSLVTLAWYPQPRPPIIQGENYMIVPTTVPDTDDNGNAYWDIPSTDANRVVTANINVQDPKVNGYPQYPIYKGSCQVDSSARLTFEGGKPHIGPFEIRVVVEA